MFIAETFVSLQGEGILAGIPSFFIRTSGCNLRCRWCDTPYTSWKPEGERRSVGVLLNKLESCSVRHVVITGGEPLLQREIAALTRSLRLAGYHITVETAGTVDPQFECDLLSLSPKTRSSDPQGVWRERHQQKRSAYQIARRLITLHSEYQVKFVVVDEDDLTEIFEIIELLGVRDRDRVLLMPEGRTENEVRGRQELVAALCVEHGFRYTPRLHLDLYGGARGT